jgi:hypothetical protein
MRMFHHLLAASLLPSLTGCNDSMPISAPNPAAPSPTARVSHTVSGTLSETIDGISRPLAGRPVFLWIQEPTAGRTQSVTTDQNGRYTTQVPTARVFASAWHPPDQQQPCLASAVVDKDTTIDVEVGPSGGPATPPSAAAPLITGFVYETTPQGRAPLRGVHVSVEASVDVWVAYTRTDDTGQFFLCRVNAPVQVVVSAGNGYKDWWQSIPGAGDLAWDIELTR